MSQKLAVALIMLLAGLGCLTLGELAAIGVDRIGKRIKLRIWHRRLMAGPKCEACGHPIQLHAGGGWGCAHCDCGTNDD